MELVWNDTLRFLGKVKMAGNGCLNWRACTNEYGYGLFNVKKRSRLAHRVAWELFMGPIPKGKYVLHKCDNPLCVNPEHLFIGTARDNMQDMWNKGCSAHTKGTQNLPRGESHHYHFKGPKITREQAIEIRNAKGPQAEIARKYGVDPSMVSRIKSGQYWRE